MGRLKYVQAYIWGNPHHSFNAKIADYKQDTILNYYYHLMD